MVFDFVELLNCWAKGIKDRIQKIAKSQSSEGRNTYSTAHTALLNRHKITSYKLLPKDKFDDAIK